MKTRTKIGAFKWTLSKECVPEAGSLIETHLGISVVIECEVIDYDKEDHNWLKRAISEVGEHNVLSLYNQQKQDPFFEDGQGALGLKLFTDKGPVWLMMSHTHYNMEGPVMLGIQAWCSNVYPTFTNRDPEFNYDAFNKEVA